MDVIRLSSLGLQNVQPLHISLAPRHLSLDISKIPSNHQFDKCRLELLIVELSSD
jgi:hypothetical protein